MTEPPQLRKAPALWQPAAIRSAPVFAPAYVPPRALRGGPLAAPPLALVGDTPNPTAGSAPRDRRKP